MTQKFQQFKALHQQNQPLLIGNIWDVTSAKCLESQGFQALGTSSAALAETLGYEDGEQIPFSEYLFLIKRIINSTTLSLTVDMEAGFGESNKKVIQNIKKLLDLGVVGINIEDSKMQNGVRSLIDKEIFAQKLDTIQKALKADNRELFINVRCDAFLLNIPNKLEESVSRAKLYEKTAIHGIFLPCITEEDDIKTILQNISLPLNVMSMSNLPDFNKLKELGVKRISMGNFLHKFGLQVMQNAIQEIIKNQNFDIIFK